MKYANSSVYLSPEMEKLISKFDFNPLKVELRFSTIPEKGYYESSVVLEIEDGVKAAEIKIVTRDLDVIIANHGKTYIDQDFSKEFISNADEAIYDRHHK